MERIQKEVPLSRHDHRRHGQDRSSSLSHPLAPQFTELLWRREVSPSCGEVTRFEVFHLKTLGEKRLDCNKVGGPFLRIKVNEQLKRCQ